MGGPLPGRVGGAQAPGRNREARYPLAVVAVVFYHVGQLLADTLVAEWLAGRAAAGKRS